MFKRPKNKFCSLCLQDIDDSTKYNVFKHNTLFRMDGGWWHCLMPHYVCESCMQKLQAYCQENKIEKQ